MTSAVIPAAMRRPPSTAAITITAVRPEEGPSSAPPPPPTDVLADSLETGPADVFLLVGEEVALAVAVLGPVVPCCWTASPTLTRPVTAATPRGTSVASGAAR